MLVSGQKKFRALKCQIFERNTAEPMVRGATPFGVSLRLSRSAWSAAPDRALDLGNCILVGHCPIDRHRDFLNVIITNFVLTNTVRLSIAGAAVSTKETL